jgi:hypothetical protein
MKLLTGVRWYNSLEWIIMIFDKTKDKMIARKKNRRCKQNNQRRDYQKPFWISLDEKEAALVVDQVSNGLDSELPGSLPYEEQDNEDEGEK